MALGSSVVVGSFATAWKRTFYRGPRSAKEFGVNIRVQTSPGCFEFAHMAEKMQKRMRLPEDLGPAAVFLFLQTPETMTGQVVSAPEYDQEQGIQVPSAYDRLYSG